MTKRATLTKALDSLWRDIVKAKGMCEVCGKTENLNAHHIVGRRNHFLRWDIKNGIALCAGCHTFKLNSAHQNPVWFHNWMLEHIPGTVDYLVEQVKVQPRPIKEFELRQIYETLKEKYGNS